MTNLDLKKSVISDLESKGINFQKDAFQLSPYENSLLLDAAKSCKYRKPKNSYFGLGASFFIHLQKMANK